MSLTCSSSPRLVASLPCTLSPLLSIPSRAPNLVTMPREQPEAAYVTACGVGCSSKTRLPQSFTQHKSKQCLRPLPPGQLLLTSRELPQDMLPESAPGPQSGTLLSNPYVSL